MSKEIIEIVWFVAAFLTTTSFLPQALKTIKTKKTEGLSLTMYSLFVIWVFTWLMYWILTKSNPIIIANLITLILSWIILWYILKYRFNK